MGYSQGVRVCGLHLLVPSREGGRPAWPLYHPAHQPLLTAAALQALTETPVHVGSLPVLTAAWVLSGGGEQ